MAWAFGIWILGSIPAAVADSYYRRSIKQAPRPLNGLAWPFALLVLLALAALYPILWFIDTLGQAGAALHDRKRDH